uniref:Uncharacterized protein n=1 Tax=Varanus komodoensis TaxID=61221 RepID=A0A8D2IXF0_VARKO
PTHPITKAHPHSVSGQIWGPDPQNKKTAHIYIGKYMCLIRNIYTFSRRQLINLLLAFGKELCNVLN